MRAQNVLSKLGLISALLITLTGCAVNRVDEVKSAGDAESLYKVPVVYGIGIAKDSLPTRSSDIAAIGFAEYDPVTKRGTSSCLGSADVLWVSFRVPFREIPQDHYLHYHVLMVPPGYYALTMGIKPHEANPSLYIKIEDSGPQYLGDFWLTETHDPKYKSLAQLSTLPVEYHPKDAVQALQAFGISSDPLPQVPLVPTDGGARFLLCTP
jgi:hypothetical protein